MSLFRNTLIASVSVLLLASPSILLAANPPATLPATVKPEAQRQLPRAATGNLNMRTTLGTESFRRSGGEVYSARRGDLSMACGFRDIDAGYLASIGAGDGGNVLCGACAEVSGPSGTVLVKITSFDPPGTVPAGVLQIEEAALTAVAGRSTGRAAVTWRIVPCPAQGALRYRFRLTGSFWTGVAIENHCHAISRIEIRPAGGAWQSLTRGATWTPPGSAASQGVVDLRVRDFDGRVSQELGLNVRAPSGSSELLVTGSATPAGCR